jgi:cytidine deaminase
MRRVAGEHSFEAIAVVSSGGAVVPCGVCLQALYEFCTPDMPVICEHKRLTLGELLPHAFSLKGR